MKGLTIEQKARLYDETIEKLREFYRDYDTISCLIDVKEELANLFPELKESEDERIRKELIAFIKKRDRSGCDYDYNKWLAWLEKQGEQKPTDKAEPKFKVGDWVVTLMKEMANAGYTFDFEKKELKNIEPKTLDPDKVIEWISNQACLGFIEDIEVEKFVEQFKKDFGL